MSIFKTKNFDRFARKQKLDDDELREAVTNVTAGRIDADLGGGVIKQRIARDGAGKSGGFRTIILFRGGSNVFFVHGYAKKRKANISKDELTAFRSSQTNC